MQIPRPARSNLVRAGGLAALAGVLFVLAVAGRGGAGEGGAPAPPPGGARRIVSLVPSVTETIFALGEAGRLVAVSTFCDRPAEAAALPRAGSYLAPSVETIVGLRPDVVIGVPTPGNQAAVEQLRGLGIPVVIVGETTLEDAWDAIRTIGRWVGRPDAAGAMVDSIRADLEATRRRVPAGETRRVLFVVGHDPLVTVGRGLFLDDLIGVAGGVNVGVDGNVRWPRLSLEAALAASPDVIIDGAMGSEGGATLRAWWEPYRSVPAVRDGRVRAQSSDALLRPGPRLGQAAQELFDLIWEPGVSR